MIKEPIVRELPDGSALVSFEGLSIQELQIFAGIGLLSVLKDAVADFTEDLEVARALAAKANKVAKKKTVAKKPNLVKKTTKRKCK